MIHNARKVYKKTSKSFQMSISSVAVHGNHGGGDKVWKTNNTSRANCLLGSYKSQLKPQFDHRRLLRRFGRIWNCATLFNCSTTPAETWKSHQKTGRITKFSVRGQGWCFFGSKLSDFLIPEPPQPWPSLSWPWIDPKLRQDDPEISQKWKTLVERMKKYPSNRNWMTLGSYKKPLQPKGALLPTGKYKRCKKSWTLHPLQLISCSTCLTRHKSRTFDRGCSDFCIRLYDYIWS